jgi:hypothetical protein
MNGIGTRDQAQALASDLRAKGFTVHVEEIKSPYDPPATGTYDTYKVWCEPKRLNAAEILRAVALQYDHFSFCHLDEQGRMVYSGAREDA